MMSILARLASLKLSLAGMLGVLALALISNRVPEFSTTWLAVPFAFLSANLLAAILTNGVFRKQAALLVFHVCLLAMVILIGLSILIRFEGRVELVEGELFDRSSVTISNVGPWHPMGLDEVAFEQGEISVDYLPGLIRRHTQSVIREEKAADGVRALVVGDRASARLDAYRFTTTFNKGLALVVLWSDDDGDLQRGSINFPSYPEFEWKQINSWTSPAGEQVDLELKLTDAAPRGEAWVLRSRDKPFSVSVSADGSTPRLLQQGDSLQLRDGVLVIEDLRLWMGYRVDFDPLLPWIFAAAMCALLALACHFQARYWPARQETRTAVLGGIRAYDGSD